MVIPFRFLMCSNKYESSCYHLDWFHHGWQRTSSPTWLVKLLHRATICIRRSAAGTRSWITKVFSVCPPSWILGELKLSILNWTMAGGAYETNELRPKTFGVKQTYDWEWCCEWEWVDGLRNRTCSFLMGRGIRPNQCGYHLYYYYFPTIHDTRHKRIRLLFRPLASRPIFTTLVALCLWFFQAPMNMRSSDHLCKAP